MGPLRPLPLALFFGAFLFGLLLWMPTTLAAANALTCSSVTTTLAGATRTWTVSDATNSACPGTSTLREVGSGSALTMTCVESTTGGVPPAAATQLRIRGYADSASFGNPAGTPVWNLEVPGDACGASTSLTFSCTVDGTAGGSPRYGPIRIMVHAINNPGVEVYNVNSDSTGTWGFYRCNPQVSTFTDGNTGSSPTTYVPTDTIRTQMTVDSTAYQTGTNAQPKVTCGAATNNGPATIELSTSAFSSDLNLKGSLTTWPDDCTLVQKVEITKKSAISGLTTQDYMKWDTTGAPAGVTFSGQTAQRNAKTYDRTLTQTGSFSQHFGGTPHADYDRFLRLQAQHVHSAGWQDARSQAPANNQLTTTFARRDTQAAFDVTDFVSVDGTFGASGTLTDFTMTSKNTATVTNSTGALDYLYDIKTFSASRIDSELLYIGSTSNKFDISATFGSNGILNTNDNLIQENQTRFLLGADLEFVSVRRLMDAEGNPVSGISITCIRQTPQFVNEPTVDLGTTDSSGNTALTEFEVHAPAGTWRLTCNANSNGNTYSYEITFIFVSPLSSNQDILVVLRPWNVSGQIFLNVTANAVQYDATLIPCCVAEQQPDDTDVRLFFSAWDYEGDSDHEHIFYPRGRLMTTTDGVHYTSNFSLNSVLPANFHLKAGAIQVAMNFTGKSFLVSEFLPRDTINVTWINVERRRPIDFGIAQHVWNSTAGSKFLNVTVQLRMATGLSWNVLTAQTTPRAIVQLWDGEVPQSPVTTIFNSTLTFLRFSDKTWFFNVTIPEAPGGARWTKGAIMVQALAFNLPYETTSVVISDAFNLTKRETVFNGIVGMLNRHQLEFGIAQHVYNNSLGTKFLNMTIRLVGFSLTGTQQTFSFTNARLRVHLWDGETPTDSKSVTVISPTVFTLLSSQQSFWANMTIPEAPGGAKWSKGFIIMEGTIGANRYESSVTVIPEAFNMTQRQAERSNIQTEIENAMVTVHTIFDATLIVAIWGFLALYCARTGAWVPAIMAAFNTLNALLPDPAYSWQASVMLFTLVAAVWAMLRWWTNRPSKDPVGER